MGDRANEMEDKAFQEEAEIEDYSKIEITDKQRLDFLEKNFLEVLRTPEEETEWMVCDGYSNEWFGKTIRESIDEAIFQMEWKE